MEGRFVILSGSANQALSKAVSAYLETPLCGMRYSKFSDGETYCQILDNVRGADVYVIQPTCQPVNENLMELLIILDALKRSSAGRVCAVIPYYGYARQDRKDRPRVPITASLVADLLQTAGISRILCVDLHAAQIQGFFEVPVDHLFAAPVLIRHIAEQGMKDLTIVSPDAGGVERARAYAKRLNATLAIVDKRREVANVAEVMHVIGEVEGRNCFVVDDIIDTAGTLCETAKALMGHGALSVHAACTHPVLSGPALDRISSSPITSVVVTDTIPAVAKRERCDKIRILSIAPLIGEAMKRIHEESSVSSLFV